MSARSRTLLIQAMILALLAVGPAAARAPWPEDDWPKSTPREQGLGGKSLAELRELIRQGRRYPDIHGLLVVKNGYLVVEDYFDGHGPDDLHTLQSVSKSVTSALVGIAIEQGAFRGVDEKVLDFFPGLERIENVDARKRAMRLEDLLTMRSGTDYDEGYSGSPHSTLNSMSRGWTRFILSRPMVHRPGTHFQYDSGAVILTSALIKARTGLHADAYAEKHLLPHLGIERVRWFSNAEGHPHTGGGLDLRPRDMARFGLLYLRGGKWKDRQVVHARWVAESTRHHVTLDRPGSKVTGYGYWWWIGPPAPGDQRPIYSARGFRGQYIFVVPEHDLVVVVTAGAHGQNQRKPVDFLYRHILPAVTDSSP
ncbi:MAG: serine hydrolase [bacterium]|nr:serine hydrolase [bacterium]